MRILLLLFVPSILSAEIVGYEYYVPKTETQAISDMSLMTGTKSETEKYQTLTRKDVSTTLDSYVENNKCYKTVLIETKDVRPNGITATFLRKEGNVPSDLNYSSEAELRKRIDAEIQRLKAEEDRLLEEQAKKNLGL